MNLSKPQVDESFRVLHKKAHEFVTDQHEILTEDFSFGAYDQYSLDTRESNISFVKDGEEVLKAGFQAVGYWDENSGLWTWRWANPAIPSGEVEELDIIRNYGEFFNYGLLTQAEWPATEGDAWAVTAIAAYLRGGKGIFKIQIDGTPHFVYFTKLLTT